MAQPLVAARQLEVEVTQESIHGDAVGERDTEVVGEFVQPAGEGCALAELQREAELLVGLEPLVGLGAHRGQPVLLGQQVVAGAAKRRQPPLRRPTTASCTAREKRRRVPKSMRLNSLISSRLKSRSSLSIF